VERLREMGIELTKIGIEWEIMGRIGHLLQGIWLIGNVLVTFPSPQP
jgi:hypothetical protein